MKTRKLKLILILSGLLLMGEVFPQQKTNVKNLEQISSAQNQLFQQRSEIVKKFAAEQGIEIRSVFEDGSIIELVDVINGQPVYCKTDNLGAATTTRANQLWQYGSLGLTVEGLNYSKIGIWDGGAVRQTHQEFTNTGQSRIQQTDGATSLSSHATHVAGTIMAGGVNPTAKGMAFKAQLKANDWNNVESEMATAAAAGMEISNHSWGYITGWNYNQSTSQWEWYGDGSVSANEDYLFGFYNSQASLWDQIAYNAPYFLITKSAGNDRGDGPANAGTNGVPEKDGGADGFDCIGGAGNAKNVLTVGAVNEVPQYNGPESVTMSSFSSWGPTDDGRIKPDIVGKGVNTFSAIADANDAYASYNGTSMSSPNVAGSMVLLQQLYQNLNNETPMLASTLKALVIHTADEAGPAPGPDYMFGWGLMNTERAAVMILENNPQNNLLTEETLQPSQVFEKQIQANGTEPLKVTLCWTDVNASVPVGMLNNRNSVLLHDLDLVLIDEQMQTYYPYQLNPEQPSLPATNTQKNDVDNVEQVFIPNASGSYTLRISHDGNLLSAQDFSIIISGSNAYEGIPFCSSGLVYPIENSQSNPVNLTMEWAAAPYATAYHVFFGSDGEGLQTPGNIHNGTIVNENALAVTLDTNTTYYLQILPKNSYGVNQSCTEIRSFKTANASELLFPPPTNLSASVNILNVTLNWSPPQFPDLNTNNKQTGALPDLVFEMAPAFETDNTKGLPKRIPQGSKSFEMENVLYDNGPFINSPGTGPEGADESILQNSLGMSTLGMGVQYLSGNRRADEFTVTSSWGIDNIVVFAYQTGSPPSSSMTEAYLQIWDDNPMNGGSIIWGDMLTNRLSSTGWTNTYRLSQTTPGTTRPIMYLEIATDGLMLEPGTFWIDFSLVGSLSSGPWVPPVTINGETTTGNSLQFLGSNQSWMYFSDSGTGTYQGIPFLVRGNNLGGHFPVSYNIYLDDALIANVPSYQNQYIDEEVEPGDHIYGVSAVYETPAPGESSKVVAAVNVYESYLNVSPDSLMLNRLSGSFSLNINSNVNWVLPQHQGWVIPETPSGSNNSTLHFTYEANPYADPRQAIMRFEVPGSSLAKEIFILQEPTLQFLNIFPLTREINAASGSTFFYVTSNGSWTLNTDASWLTLSQVSGNGNNSLEVIVEQNNTNEVRQAVINIITEDGLESFPVIVAQACESCFAPPQQVTASVTGFEVNLNWERPSLINSPANNKMAMINIQYSPILNSEVEHKQFVINGSSKTLSGANPFSLSPSNVNINTRSTYNEWIPIRHDNGVNSTGVGLTSGGTFNIATRFSAEEIQQYSSHELTQIELFFNDFPTQCVLKVYDEGTIGSPGNLLLSQVVETLSIGWNIFVLNSPVALTGNDLWIGYELTNNPNSLPAGLDTGPVHPDGDWLSLDGQNWERLSVYGFNGNWNIVGYLSESGNNTSYRPASYNIYRDNTLLGNTESNIKNFIDVVGTAGTYTYGISAVYDSPFSGESSIIPLEVNVETPYIEVQPGELTVTYNNQWVHFEIQSNTYWQVENNTNWFVISQGNGSHTQLIDISVDNNPMAFDRTGHFTVSSLDGSISITVSIHQEAAPPALALSPHIQELHALSGNISFNLISNTDWQMSTNADWITISPESGIGNSSIQIDFEANETNAIRSALVTATSVDGSVVSNSQIFQSPSNNFLPPANLTGHAVGYQVQLSWDAPSLTTSSTVFSEDFENEAFPPKGWNSFDMDAEATPRFWQSSPAQNKTTDGSISVLRGYSNQSQTSSSLRWDNGVFHEKLGLSSGGTMNIAAYFPEAELTPFIGQKIEAIEFYIADAPSSCYLKIYGQGPDPLTEEPILIQQVTPVPNAWNTFMLDFPVTIEGVDLYFGYEVTHAANLKPSGHDSGPANPGFGDLISLDNGNSWSTLYSLGINNNWNLVAHLSPEGGSSLYGPSTYKIFRNGNHIETLNKFQKTYSEFHFEEGTHTYAVSAVYDNPSGESEAVPVEIVIAITGNNAMPRQHYLPKSGGEVRSVVLNFSSIQVLYNPEWTTVAVEPFNGTTSVHIQYTENTSGQVRTGSVQMSDGSVIVLVQQPENNSLISYFETPRINQNHQIVFVSDLNEDGRQDLMIKKGEPVSKLDFYIDNGNTQEFLAEMDVPVYAYPYDSESFVKKSNRQEHFLTDIDNDGHKDLLVWAANHASCTDNMIKIYWGSNQQPYFDPLDFTVLESSYPYCVGAYAVDFNGDALVDVYIRSASGVNTMYHNVGNRNFSMVTTFNPGRDIEVIFEDVDADGFKDMIYTKNGWADGQWGLRMNKSLGNGDFNSNTHVVLHNELPLDGLMVLQANPQTDNHPDFLAQCSNDGFNTTAFYLLSWDETQQLFTTKIFHSGNNPYTTALHALDYNNDGFEDIIFRYLNQGELLRYSMGALINDGDGNFFSSEIIHSGLDFIPLQYFRNENDSYIAGYRDTNFNDALLVIYKTEDMVNSTYLEVNPVFYNSSAAAASTHLQISSNTQWTVTNPNPWISCGQTEGIGNHSLIVNIEENTQNQSRFASLSIQSTDGNHTVEITIEQDAAPQNCTPSWSPLPNLQYNMQIVAQILIDGQVSLNPNDVVGAFVGDECRGIGSPSPEFNGLVFLTVSSNVASGEQIELKIWNSSDCSDCNAIPGFAFVNQAEIGTFLEPYQVRCGAIQDITFGQGYTWFSLNVNPGSMSPNSLFTALTPCYDDRVIGQTSFALYTGSSWIGSLTNLGLDKMYRMKLCSAQSLSLMGDAAPLSTINLAAGYTWLGYQPQECQSVSAAMAGLSPGPAYDDRVIGQNSFALFTGSTWVGSLTQMCPGKGYVVKLANAQTLTYPVGASKSSTDLSEEIISPTGVYPVEGLQHTMMVVGRLQLNDGSYSTNPKDVIYGFVDEECRGIAIPSNELNGLIFMSLGSNIESGEIVSFKVWIDAAQTLLPLNELIPFEAMQSVGGLDNPFLFTLGEMVGVAEMTDGIWIGEPYPNPFTKSVSIKLYVNAPSEVSVNLYDPLGAILYRQSVNYPNAGLYTLDIEPKSIASTLYHLELMISQEKSQTKKYFKIIKQ